MDAFAAAVAVIFGDPNMAAAATHHPAGGAAGRSCRVHRRAPDVVDGWNGGGVVADSVILEVRVAEAPTLEIGDRFVMGDEILEVTAAPTRDELGLVWTAEARRL